MEINNMAKGFRTQPQGNRKEKLREHDAEIKNVAMSVRINQMMTQQLMQNLKGMHEDIGKALNLISEMQYKILAIQKVSGLDVLAMNEVANEQRLQDFCEASDKEDAEKGFTHGEAVNEQSTVIITSTTKETDKGIFRSRLKLSECGVPELIKAFMGANVGTTTNISLNGVDHEIELLAIRQPPAVTSTPDGEDATETTSTAPLNSAPAETQSAQVTQ
jgi:hypothetical protein